MTGIELKKARLKLGFTQTELAETMGRETYATICKYERRGNKEIPAHAAKFVTELLHVKELIAEVVALKKKLEGKK